MVRVLSIASEVPNMTVGKDVKSKGIESDVYLTRRPLRAVLAGATDMADDVLRVPAPSQQERAGLGAINEQVHHAVRDEDFAMLPSCGEGVRQGQHDHMVLGCNETGVQHLVRVLAADLGIAVD